MPKILAKSWPEISERISEHQFSSGFLGLTWPNHLQGIDIVDLLPGSTPGDSTVKSNSYINKTAILAKSWPEIRKPHHWQPGNSRGLLNLSVVSMRVLR